MNTQNLNSTKQRGVVLFISLIIIVAMMLTGLAVMRSVGAGTLIAGNLAFQQGAQAAAERGVELAHAWLLDNSNNLQNDDTDNGYYSSWINISNSIKVDGFDPTTYDWSNAYTVPGGTDNAGNTVRYVIHRLCDTSNTPISTAGVVCVKFSPLTGGGNNCGNGNTCGGISVGSQALPVPPSPYYRITVRADGPRNSVSYVQAIIM